MTLDELISHHCAKEQDECTKDTIEALRRLKKLDDFERQRTSRLAIPEALRANREAKVWHWNEHNYEEKPSDNAKQESPTNENQEKLAKKGKTPYDKGAADETGK